MSAQAALLLRLRCPGPALCTPCSGHALKFLPHLYLMFPPHLACSLLALISALLLFLDALLLLSSSLQLLTATSLQLGCLHPASC